MRWYKRRGERELLLGEVAVQLSSNPNRDTQTRLIGSNKILWNSIEGRSMIQEDKIERYTTDVKLRCYSMNKDCLISNVERSFL